MDNRYIGNKRYNIKVERIINVFWYYYDIRSKISIVT